MAIKKYKPTTPGRRGMTVTDYSVLSKVDPERSLLECNIFHLAPNFPAMYGCTVHVSFYNIPHYNHHYHTSYLFLLRMKSN